MDSPAHVARIPGSISKAGLAFIAYFLIAIAATWPLTRGLARDIPWDLGDPVLVLWVLAWDCEQLLRILGGDVARIATFFDANIFYPTPLTLAYSEHFMAQAIQILPVYAITGNPILAYNVLFLSTWVLSGLGMYLLVRELTGSAVAGFVGGLLFAFAPYRVPQSGHLHVLSSQWMPFTLYGLRRYFVTRRRLPLAGAAIALVLQCLSSGYYLLFFSPLVVAFAVWEIASRRLWRDLRMWRDLVAAGAVVAALVVPFLLPYAALRETARASRPIAEVELYSADVYSYATAFSAQRVWGSILQMFRKPEGELFPGAIPTLLAFIGLVAFAVRCATTPTSLERGWRRWLAWFLAFLAVSHALGALAAVAFRRVTLDAGLFELRITNINQMILRSGIALGLLLILSPAARTRFVVFMRERGFWVVGIVLVMWVSLGPSPRAFGRPLEILSTYRLLYDYVPAFDGLRVPARFAMLVALMLAVLAGYGAHLIARFRGGTAVLAVACVLFLLESTSVPFTLNGMAPIRDLVTPEARIYPPREASDVYRVLGRQPEDSVLVELPLGQPDYDVRAVYYSTIHWRPLINGYSGFFPPYYGLLITALSEIPRHPEVSLDAIRSSGATHAIVHESAYRNGEGEATSAILRDAGAVEVFRQGSDVLLRLSR
ncbi:MAG: hypothetical protein HOP16_10680 [Acidobacteria bacterium]|nr:hypothetical protein [Acidobacteriota bacterium]